MLKNQLLIVNGEVGLGILPPEGELPNIFQMLVLFGQQKLVDGPDNRKNRSNRNPS